MSKPISATKARNCIHCETTQVKNLVGKEETRYICDLINGQLTYKQPCTIRDWMRCDRNDDK
jgi:hypothetical protein